MAAAKISAQTENLKSGMTEMSGKWCLPASSSPLLSGLYNFQISPNLLPAFTLHYWFVRQHKEERTKL